VSGEVINNMDAFNTSSYGFETSVVCKLRQEDMQKCYNQTDVYVNAAWYEGFGLPSLEAMACGVPVVQADNQGLNGVIRNKENCILVPPAEPAAMAEAIKHVLTDESVRSRMVTNGLNTAKEYSIARQYRMFVDEFQTILACRFDEYQTAQKISELEQGSLDERLHHLKSLRA
jgi:glycosyltransferase involved in cell wall biosynthesis